jgi:ubiquinone/menaquinone biosynthesis C-methylase UbiE
LRAQAVAVASDEAHAFFDSYSKYYDLAEGFLPLRKLMWDAFQALELGPGMRILDAGCGTGSFEKFISEKPLPPITIEAIDFSEGMLSQAAEKCSDLGFATFAHGDLGERLPFPDATFDRIVSINVLYAVPDWRATVRELVRVLKPGGLLVVTSTKVGWRYWPMLSDHFSRVRNIWGAKRKALAVPVKWLTPKGLGLLASLMLGQDRLEREGRFPSFTEEELREYLQAEAGVAPLDEFDVWPAYCNQNLMAYARKSPALAS